MNEQIKQLISKSLLYLKDKPYINDLTISELFDRIEQSEDILRSFIELLLNDEEGQNGTLTSWWLYEDVDKKIYQEVEDHQVTYDVQDAEDFVNFMLDSNGKNK